MGTPPQILTIVGSLQSSSKSILPLPRPLQTQPSLLSPVPPSPAMGAIKLLLLACLALALLHSAHAAGDSFWGGSCGGSLTGVKSCGPFSICDTTKGNSLKRALAGSRTKRGLGDIIKGAVENTSGQCRPSPTFWILLVLGIVAVIAATACACICLPCCVLYKFCGALRGGE